MGLSDKTLGELRAVRSDMETALASLDVLRERRRELARRAVNDEGASLSEVGRALNVSPSGVARLVGRLPMNYG